MKKIKIGALFGIVFFIFVYQDFKNNFQKIKRHLKY